MEWFRMYMADRKNPQLNILSDAEFRVWFCLLCYAAEQEQRGTIVFSNHFKLAAEVARGDENLLSTTMDKLDKMEYITVTDTTILFNDFAKRQYQRPSDSPEKTRERKQKSRSGLGLKVLSHATVTHESRDSHANVTHESHTHTDHRLQITDNRSKDKEIPLPAVADEGSVSSDGAQSDSPTGNAHDMRTAENSGYTPEFEEFWQQYPRKIEKKAAFTRWKVKVRSVSAQILIEAARGYRGYSEHHQTEERFMMHATTFLGPNDRYEEYVGYVPTAVGTKRAGQTSPVAKDSRYNAFYELFPDA